MRRLILLAALVFLATTAAPRAFAQDADRVTCFSLNSENYKDKDKFTPGEDACTRMINSGKFSGKGLASIHRARGSWRQKKDDLDASLADYAIAIKIEPKNVENFDYRADVYQQKGDFDRALADYDRASKLDPLYAAAHFSRGMVFEKKKDLDKARAEYNIAIALPNRDRIAQWAQDNARARLKAMDEAKEKEETKK
jgi:tetratricopeptide (TPR) repeat protein